MKRSDFIKNFIGVFGLSAIAPELVQQYQKIPLLNTFVRGFRYYEGPSLLRALKKEKKVQLVRDYENLYDEHAIAVFFHEKKIGYLPAEKNLLLSKILDFQLLDLSGEVLRVEPKAKEWEQLYIGVYTTKPLDALTHQTKALIQEKLPYYHSIKLEAGEIQSQILYESNKKLSGKDFFRLVGLQMSLKSFSYKLTNQGLSPELFSNAIDQKKVVINKSTLPQRLSFIDSSKRCNKNLFQTVQSEYFYPNFNELSFLARYILKITPIVDFNGETYCEVVFN